MKLLWDSYSDGNHLQYAELCQDLRNFKEDINKFKTERNVMRETVNRKQRVEMIDSISEIMSKVKAKVGRDRINLREKF